MILKTRGEVYLDANATTPVLPTAIERAQETMQQVYGNPSSTHTSGLKARNILESSRDSCRQVLGTRDGQIIFTSGATEAIQLAVFSTLCQLRQQSVAPPDSQRLLMYGATEHKAVPQALRHWNELLSVKRRILEIPVDRNGLLDLDFIAEHAAMADMICTMAVNNETGVITDLKAVEAEIRNNNPTVSWMVDCVQSVGKFELNLDHITIDYAPISGHKIYAPKGIGLLYARKGACIVPLLAGGSQEHGARAGTENLPGVAAISAIFELLSSSPQKTFGNEQRLEGFRQRIVQQLKLAFPSIVFNAPFEHSVPTTINFSVKGFSSKELLDLFDAAGIRVSSGSACGSQVERSYVLDAMGVAPWQSEGAIRLSFGPLATQHEIDAACRQIEQAGQALCESCLVVSPDVKSDREPLDGLVQLKNGSMCTYLLMNSSNKRCIVIDPFAELAERIESLIRCQESQVVAVLDTHAHVDHQSCRHHLLKQLRNQVLDTAMTDDELGWPTDSDGWVELGDGSLAPFLNVNDQLVLAQTDLPGHTQVGRAFLLGHVNQQNQLLPDAVEHAFCGDMILIGGIGRTDFPSSDPELMYHSLRRLPALISSRTLICPTHDYNNDFATNLECETDDNPFLRKILDPQDSLSLAEFLQQKPAIDAAIDDANNGELVCGFVHPQIDCTSQEIGNVKLRQLLQEHHNLLIVDVREPHEYIFTPDWSELSICSKVRNIPLTRLVGMIPGLRAELTDENEKVLFLCRSGKRSGKAAEVVRRLGFSQTMHITGGLALNASLAQTGRNSIADVGFII